METLYYLCNFSKNFKSIEKFFLLKKVLNITAMVEGL
jgi:hypothetical protein